MYVGVQTPLLSRLLRRWQLPFYKSSRKTRQKIIETIADCKILLEIFPSHCIFGFRIIRDFVPYMAGVRLVRATPEQGLRRVTGFTFTSRAVGNHH